MFRLPTPLCLWGVLFGFLERRFVSFCWIPSLENGVVDRKNAPEGVSNRIASDTEPPSFILDSPELLSGSSSACFSAACLPCFSHSGCSEWLITYHPRINGESRKHAGTIFKPVLSLARAVLCHWGTSSFMYVFFHVSSSVCAYDTVFLFTRIASVLDLRGCSLSSFAVLCLTDSTLCRPLIETCATCRKCKILWSFRLRSSSLEYFHRPTARGEIVRESGGRPPCHLLTNPRRLLCVESLVGVFSPVVRGPT